jgi:hypothetical protein
MDEQFRTSLVPFVAKYLVELDVKEGLEEDIEIVVGSCIYI